MAHEERQPQSPETAPSDARGKKPPFDAAIAEELRKVKEAIGRTETMANALDKKLLDPFIGLLFPEAGDLITGGLALWIVIEAKKAGLPNAKIARMLFNIGFDTGVGMIPALGDIADFFIRSNVWNVNLMKEYAEELNAKHKEKTGKTVEEAMAEMHEQSYKKAA